MKLNNDKFVLSVVTSNTGTLEICIKKDEINF